MGRHDADHTPVIEHYMKEAARLIKGSNYYCSHSNKLERISFPILCWNADRPECQSLTNTRKEGTYGKVSQWAVNVSEDRLPACRQCYLSMVTKLTGGSGGVGRNGNIERQCTKCANWSLVRNKDGVQIEECMNDLVSKDYPKHYPEMTCVDTQPEGRTSSHKKTPTKETIHRMDDAGSQDWLLWCECGQVAGGSGKGVLPHL